MISIQLFGFAQLHSLSPSPTSNSDSGDRMTSLKGRTGEGKEAVSVLGPIDPANVAHSAGEGEEEEKKSSWIVRKIAGVSGVLHLSLKKTDKFLFIDLVTCANQLVGCLYTCAWCW